MGTPALITFESANESVNPHSFYFNHDGYDQGMATFLWKAIDYVSRNSSHKHRVINWEECRDGLAGAFYRANDNAEFDPGNMWVEFSYLVDVDKMTILGEHLEEMPLVDFVNQHAQPDWIDSDFTPVAECARRHCESQKCVFTAANGSKFAGLLRGKAVEYGPDNPNSKSFLDMAKRLEDATSEVATV